MENTNVIYNVQYIFTIFTVDGISFCDTDTDTDTDKDLF